MLEKTAAVFLVLGLLVVTLLVLRRKGLASLNVTLAQRSPAGRKLRVVERLPLTAHHSLHLIRVQDRLILIGVSPSSCNQIHSFTVLPDEAAAAQENQ